MLENDTMLLSLLTGNAYVGFCPNADNQDRFFEPEIVCFSQTTKRVFRSIAAPFHIS
jgi:hypothetical protein